MLRLAVESTSLVSISYAPERSVLELEFRDGSVYSYLDVPPECVQELTAADSNGAYFNRHIRNRFRCHRVSAAYRAPREN